MLQKQLQLSNYLEPFGVLCFGEYMDEIIIDKLNRLKMSKFRSSFKLKDKDIKYIEEKGIDKIREHAYDFIRKRLALAKIDNDGKQTPMRGHPVFVSQHATGTCCRGCLYKWHGISKNKELSKYEIDYIVKVIMSWIEKEIN